MDQLEQLLDQLPPELAEMLPEEVQALLDSEKEKKAERLDMFSQVVARKRDEAVKAREQSGIEDEWLEDEESYMGIDETNRDQAKWVKSPSVNGTPYRPASSDQGPRSTVFLNITRPYCDAASARVGDMLLPTDDRNWSIRPTPIPQLSELAKMPVPQAMAQTQMGVAVQQAQQELEAAKQKAESAQKRIEDWHIECQWHAEVRKVIEDCSRIGTGVLKGPFPTKRKSKKAMMTPEGMALQIQMEIVPAAKRVDPWNLFPAPDCGEDIHNGSYIVERDYLTAKQLRDLVGVDGYLAEQIEAVLAEGPQKANQVGTPNPHEKVEVKDSERFEVWYFYGSIEKDDLEASGIESDKEQEYGLITLVNSRVIKAALNPMESGEFPYDLMPWQRRAGSPFGMGVCRQIRTPQRMLNAAVRNMMDNAGMSAGPQIAIWRNKLEPADGNWSITPRKLWYVREDADVRGVQDAIFAWNIPSLQADLNNIVSFALKMAEDCTGLPMLLQGSQGQAPDTVGGMTMLQNNASTVLRRIARTFDDYITEPHIRRWYQWLLEFGENDDEKGDFVIDARGSSALVERDIQNQSIMQMANMAAPGNPFGIDPKRWFKEACSAQKLDAKRFQFTDEEMAQQQQQQQPPPMPQIEVAKIRAQADMQKTQMQLQAKAQEVQLEAQADLQQAKMEQDRDTLYVQAQHEKVMADHQARMAELQIKKEIALLEYANKKDLQLNEIKADLAKESAKLQTQKELAGLSSRLDLHKHHSPQVATPAVEPPGRAPAGQAFQR